MKASMRNFALITLGALVSVSTYGREDINKKAGSSGVMKNGSHEAVAAACDPPSAQTDLDINNVRARVLSGMDMWWDLNTAKYEVPKGSNKNSLFAGSLWLGGIDAGGQLKVAAQTYRQWGWDIWPGPLNTVTASVDADVCAKYDKHFKMTRKMVEDFVADPSYPGNISNVPQAMLDWPAHGDPAYGQDTYLAPFFDYDGDGYYNPYAGDYPDYDISGDAGCAARLYGDQTLWWVFNDKGDIHTESGGEPIGIEIHAQAFAFATNDEINNMTFYQYRIFNRSSFQVNNTYFGQWVDPDLGNYLDDFVGCDVGRGLGYCYNGDENDEGAQGYGTNPPSIGVDFFQGPKADDNDGVDNDRDGTIDEPGEQIIMSKFVYYNNDGSVTGNPTLATDYYNYLTGFWRDGVPFTYGANAYNTGGPICNFMFPGDSDPNGWGTPGAGPQPPWDEKSSGNTPADRRFLQSAGPFTLKPGAVNTITTGAVWARAAQGGATASVDLLRVTDDKAQALFDNCFKVLNGPDAPDLTIQEMDKKLLVYITNKPSSNNYNEEYEERDPLIVWTSTNNYDTTYNFEGYQIYQVKTRYVTAADLQNPDLARLAFQCDVKNSVAQLVNYEFDQALGGNVPTEMVNGNNTGIVHSFEITKDLFASGDDRLVNHKPYYFLAISYGYNNFKKYNQADPLQLDGQKKPYKAGRRNIQVYTGIPHFPSPEAGGTDYPTEYGDGVEITRLIGQGNGGLVMDISEDAENTILTSSNHRAYELKYQSGKGPVDVKIIDPLNVPSGNFKLYLTGKSNVGSGAMDKTSKWFLIKDGTSDTIWSDRDISVYNEQILSGKFGKNHDGASYNWGLSVSIKQVEDPGKNKDAGFLEGTIQYADAEHPWLTGVPDIDGGSAYNWIRSGTVNNSDPATDDYVGLDDDEEFESVLPINLGNGLSGGTWAPYRIASHEVDYGPAWSNFHAQVKMSQLAGVDIVFTPDKSKWSRCVVIETGSDPALNAGGVDKFMPRAGQSVDKDGNADGSGTGMGWFPGYAINVETGERLNIAFGENSWLAGDNGNDMKFNPTATYARPPIGTPVWGGMHMVYVFGHNKNTSIDMPAYDEGAYMYNMLSTGNSTDRRNVLKDCMWVGIPMLVSGETLLANEARIRLRVRKPYTRDYAIFGETTDTLYNTMSPQAPAYSFSTKDIKTVTKNTETAKNAMDLINVVPNPYYAYSEYESNQIDSRIKITNLPEKCTVSIYTLNGTLIRKFKKDEPLTSLDWDLKNAAGIPVASGIYIIHIDAGAAGEKILKWFGVMRPIDLDTF